jgi:type IV secretion system protein VirB9
MIRGTFQAAAALAVLAAPGAWAADDRLVMHGFAENEVVRIDGRPGVQATIQFGEGEAIENVAIGDSQSWQVTPNKRADLLFVKPVEPGARTNMTVVTDRHTYFFDLVSAPRSKPVYLLRFTYKDAPKKADADTALTAAEQAALANPDALQADPALLNFAWNSKGDSRVLPARVYDDGSATYLLWGEKAQIPAILTLNEKGEEGPLNYSVRGRTIVIDDVPRTILLRSGKASATLANARPASSAASAAAARVPAPPPSGPAALPEPAGEPAPRLAPASVASATNTPPPVREN